MNLSHNPFQDVLDESFTVRDPDGKVVHTSYTDSGAKKKAAELTQQTGKTHTTGYSRTAMVPHNKTNEEVELEEAVSGLFEEKKLAIAAAVANRLAEMAELDESINDDDWYVYDPESKKVHAQFSPAPKKFSASKDRDARVPDHIMPHLKQLRQKHGDHLVADKGMTVKWHVK